jgi:hypothetical protein
MSELLEPDPHQDRTSDVITDNSGLATLATFQSGELLGLSVKLLNSPTRGAHLLHGLHIVLCKIVGNDIVHALGRQHHPE